MWLREDLRLIDAVSEMRWERAQLAMNRNLVVTGVQTRTRAGEGPRPQRGPRAFACCLGARSRASRHARSR